MVDLPHDIWEVISQHIPRKELLNLAAVNRPFYNIVLNTRYKEIWWVKLDESMVEYLRRLQDPAVARRVRRLHIRAWFIDFLLKREVLLKASKKKFEPIVWVKTLLNLNIPDAVPDPPIRNSPSILLEHRLGTMFSPGEIMRAMIKAISGMVNVMEYDFEWRDLPMNEDTQIFLMAARNTFATGLCKLVLSAQISKLVQLLTMTDFERLEEIEFSFEYTPLEASGGTTPKYILLAENLDRDLLAVQVASFINRLSSSLRCLTISSLAQCDHSPFFQCLTFLPALRYLAIRMAFDMGHLMNPAGFFRFLITQASTLFTLELRPDRPPSKNHMLAQYRQDLVEVVLRANLESLTIPSFDQQIAVSLIDKSIASLTSLSLLHRFLNVTEVAEIVNMFSTAGRAHNLIRLSLEVKSMSPRLMNVLSVGLPALASLTLVIEDESHFGSQLVEPPGIYTYRTLVDWRLLDISIYIRSQRPDSIEVIPWTRMENRMMLHLSFIMRSIRYFRGQDPRIVVDFMRRQPTPSILL
ncbi:hypothetical protein BDZ94DRAFT_1318558 [Collybia nuda]|uniref:F-box domain-containing protein n=1 Tax=Collybia nuda TaxID=64659 RepID=A0A9P5YGT2_9AGAR|nr:hypothetical protein BDZ94DRAFT_1318558 [Collybia nuda]